MPHTVVVIDDIADVRALLRTAIRLEGDLNIVGEAATGAAGVKLVSQIQPGIVVLDLRLPDVSGRRVFNLVRRSAPRSRVVVFAAADTDRRWYERRGAKFVRKDDPIGDLIAAMTVASE